MKFRAVLKTKTKNGHELVLKLNIPPSKHLGLSNFMKIALDEENPNNDVTFAIEKIGLDKKHVESSMVGNFKFEKKEEKSNK